MRELFFSRYTCDKVWKRISYKRLFLRSRPGTSLTLLEMPAVGAERLDVLCEWRKEKEKETLIHRMRSLSLNVSRLRLILVKHAIRARLISPPVMSPSAHLARNGISRALRLFFSNDSSRAFTRGNNAMFDVRVRVERVCHPRRKRRKRFISLSSFNVR